MLCLSDRCAIEDEYADGKLRLLDEREEQRKRIVKWLKAKDYYDFLSEKEKAIMNIPLSEKKNEEIFSMSRNYEFIEPMIWAVGLTREISDYRDYSATNFHFFLKIGPDHTQELLDKSSSMWHDEVIEKQRKIAELWYWRALEHKKGLLKKGEVPAAIDKKFGEAYTGLLDSYKWFDCRKGDFLVGRKTVADLNEQETDRLCDIAMKRSYALEWICSDDEWE